MLHVALGSGAGTSAEPDEQDDVESVMTSQEPSENRDEASVTTSDDDSPSPEDTEALTAGSACTQSRQYTMRAGRNKPSVKLDGLFASCAGARVCQRAAMFFLGAPQQQLLRMTLSLANSCHSKWAVIGKQSPASWEVAEVGSSRLQRAPCSASILCHCGISF